MNMLKLTEQEQFIHQVKIRIGEPITALDVNYDQVGFGSISGYFGVHNLDTKQTKYVPEVFEEIIRGIYLKNKTQALIAVGDVNAVLVDLQNVTDKYKHNKFLFQNHLEKDQNKCASTISYQRDDQIVLITCSPTQNKDAIIDISQLKKYFYLFDYSQLQSINEDVITLEEYVNKNVPEIYVPYDYDDHKIVILEYLKDNIKQVKILDLLNPQTVETPLVWDKKVEFISFIRKRYNIIVFVQNHQDVYVHDTLSKQTQKIYSHSDTVQALNVQVIGRSNVNQQSQKKKEKEEEQKREETKIGLSDLEIYSVDYNLKFNLFERGSLSKQLDLYKIAEKQNEMVQRHRYIFDMGYPYYIKYSQGILALSSDIGVLIYRIKAQ